ncbi:unnamed protein product [Caenorhabditis auriculariae]|uniref:Uncharacterized protein n=1 Tax=Caenorhabditis auriculariae TaxID=2777116 RepID=A0A8S1H9N9_9PELO|nr:unnamed protein product [Caenorhabditis auriculariae]
MPLLVVILSVAYVLVSSEGIGDVSPYGECFDTFTPTFVRTIGTRVSGSSTFVAKVDMVTCSSHCRHNYDPSTDLPSPCVGFNFRAGRSPVCQFFSEKMLFNESLHLEDTPTFYFEKTCLRSPARCAESAFMLDVRRGYRLDATAEVRPADSEKNCMETCLMEECVAFQWDHVNKKCSIHGVTRRESDSPASKANGVDYYENNCIHRGRVEFFLTRHSDVPSFGVSMGVKSIRNCMQACIQASHFFCRSLQFDAISNECFISDETSDAAVPSASLDLYEPFCVPANVESFCNRPYAFEKFVTSRMDNVEPLKEFRRKSAGACLRECLQLAACRSVNYHVVERVCSLLGVAKEDGTREIKNDENFDFYEVSCLPANVPQGPTTPENSQNEVDFHLISAQTTFRQQFRESQHIEIPDASTCGKVCESASFHCSSFVYSRTRKECFLSSSELSEDPLQRREMTQPSPDFDLYSLKQQRHSAHPTLIGEPSTATARPPRSTTQVAENDIFAFSSDAFMEPAPSATHILQEPSSSTPKGAAEASRETGSPLVPLDQELAVLSDEVPRVLPLSAGVGFVPTTSLLVAAECHENGVNVTFRLPTDTKYTGVIYASERFDQCRVFVKNSSNYAIFIPRPQHNAWCNAVEVENQLSAIVVMSNDRVTPLDVTTKDDLFYQVSCDYNLHEETIKRGIVVGGPSPIAILRDPSHVKEKISLEITRNGKVVESVFIGEPLVATVKSNISAEQLRVVDCTANRVGGNGTPASVHLIADGCALLPSIMSPMQLTAKGWQSSLSAFRIDGSEQVDVVCHLSVCTDRPCPELECPPSGTDSFAKRVTRSQNEQSSVRVDRRLVVKGDRQPPSGLLFPQICVESTTYLPAMALFIGGLVAISVSIVLTVCRSTRRDDRVEKLLWGFSLFAGKKPTTGSFATLSAAGSACHSVKVVASWKKVVSLIPESRFLCHPGRV